MRACADVLVVLEVGMCLKGLFRVDRIGNEVEIDEDPSHLVVRSQCIGDT